MSFLSRIRAMFSPPEPAEPGEPAADIELDDEGFRLGARFTSWSEVVRIRTWKVDFGDIDCVCLSLELGQQSSVEVTEESNGFNDFTDELLIRYPSIDPDWYARVVTPPFQRNEAVLYEGPAS